MSENERRYKTMTLVLNRNWGGFRLPNGFVKQYNLEDAYDFDEDTIRTDPFLIDWVRRYGKPSCGDLELVEIPDTATDYEVDEYDGWESITYVVDGKICHA